jgi:hypothetical protein
MATNVLAAARDFAAQCVFVGIVGDAVRLWLWDYPVAPVGLGLGLALGAGNGLRWWKQA